jgi:hypothetical protein
LSAAEATETLAIWPSHQKYVDDVFNARQILKSSSIHQARWNDARNEGDNALRMTRRIRFAS